MEPRTYHPLGRLEFLWVLLIFLIPSLLIEVRTLGSPLTIRAFKIATWSLNSVSLNKRYIFEKFRWNLKLTLCLLPVT